jgi:hypothetical protein
LEGLDLLLAQMEAAASPVPPLAAEPALRTLANAYLAFCQLNPNYFRLIMAFDRGRFEELIPPDLFRQVLDKSLHALGLVVQAIAAGKASGEFYVEDPRQAAGSVWAALNGVLVLMAHPLRRRMLESNIETMFQATLDLVLKGLQDDR